MRKRERPRAMKGERENPVMFVSRTEEVTSEAEKLKGTTEVL